MDQVAGCWRPGAGRIAAAMALVLATVQAQAGDYMQSSGDISYTNQIGYLWATQQWDLNGDRQDLNCRREYLYDQNQVEYGYSYYHTLYAGLGLAQSTCGAASKAGLTDLRLGVRSRWDIFAQHRTWEVEVTVPTNRSDSIGRQRVSCGAYGISGDIADQEKINPFLNVGADIGTQFWQAPLTHQVFADADIGGPFSRWSPWTWNVGLSGKMPYDGNAGPTADPNISDCGTRSKYVRGSARVGYQWNDNLNLSCGVTQWLWGVNTGITQGFSCGFSRLWK